MPDRVSGRTRVRRGGRPGSPAYTSSIGVCERNRTGTAPAYLRPAERTHAFREPMCQHQKYESRGGSARGLLGEDVELTVRPMSGSNPSPHRAATESAVDIHAGSVVSVVFVSTRSGGAGARCSHGWTSGGIRTNWNRDTRLIHAADLRRFAPDTSMIPFVNDGGMTVANRNTSAHITIRSRPLPARPNEPLRCAVGGGEQWGRSCGRAVQCKGCAGGRR